VRGNGRIESLLRFLLIHGLVLSLFQLHSYHLNDLPVLRSLVYTEESVGITLINTDVFSISL
jgi:hypothetical protein